MSSATAGRLLGLSTTAPPLIEVVEDLLTPGQGMALAMRSARRDEVGSAPRELTELVIALFRRGKVLSLADPEGTTIQTGDMVVYVRDDRPQAARPCREPREVGSSRRSVSGSSSSRRYCWRR